MRTPRFFFAAVAGVAAALATLVVLRPPHGAPTTFARVAAKPRQFAGQDVRLVGRVAVRPDLAVPIALRGAFALEGPQGHRLLVVPSGGPSRSIAVDERVRVRGRVEPLTPVADDRHGDMPGDPVSVADLAARVDAEAVVRARAVAPI